MPDPTIPPTISLYIIVRQCCCGVLRLNGRIFHCIFSNRLQGASEPGYGYPVIAKSHFQLGPALGATDLDIAVAAKAPEQGVPAYRAAG